MQPNFVFTHSDHMIVVGGGVGCNLSLSVSVRRQPSATIINNSMLSERQLLPLTYPIYSASKYKNNLLPPFPPSTFSIRQLKHKYPALRANFSIFVA